MLSKGQESWEKYPSLDGELWRGLPHPPPTPDSLRKTQVAQMQLVTLLWDLELVPFHSMLFRHCIHQSPGFNLGTSKPNIKSGRRGGNRGNHSNLNPACWSREVTPRQNKSKPQKKGRQSHVCYLLLEEWSVLQEGTPRTCGVLQQDLYNRSRFQIMG